jgi:hypothetical protein
MVEDIYPMIVGIQRFMTTTLRLLFYLQSLEVQGEVHFYLSSPIIIGFRESEIYIYIF